MGEPGRVLLGADCRGGAGTGEPGRVLLVADCRGGAGTGEPGAVLPGAARWRAKK